MLIASRQVIKVRKPCQHAHPHRPPLGSFMQQKPVMSVSELDFKNYLTRFAFFAPFISLRFLSGKTTKETQVQ